MKGRGGDEANRSRRKAFRQSGLVRCARNVNKFLRKPANGSNPKSSHSRKLASLSQVLLPNRQLKRPTSHRSLSRRGKQNHPIKCELNCFLLRLSVLTSPSFFHPFTNFQEQPKLFKSATSNANAAEPTSSESAVVNGSQPSLSESTSEHKSKSQPDSSESQSEQQHEFKFV